MARRALGIDISDASIEAVELSDGGRPSAVALGRVELIPGLVLRGKVLEAEKLAKELASALAGARPAAISGREAVINLPESQIFTAWITTEASDAEIAGEALRAATRTFPFPLEELVVDYLVVPHPKGGRDVLVAAVPKDVLGALQKTLRRAGVTASAFDLESRALVRAFGIAPKQGEAACVIDIGTRTAIVSIHDAEGLRATVNVPVGGGTMTDAVMAKLSLPAEKAEAKKRSAGFRSGANGGKVFLILQSEIQPLIREATSLIAEEEGRLGINVTSVALAGGTSLLPGIEEYLESALDRPVSVGKLAVGLPAGRERRLDPLLFANAAGLALRALRPKTDGLSFLRKIGTLEVVPAPAEARPAPPREPRRKRAPISGVKRNILLWVIILVWIAGLVGGTAWFIAHRARKLGGPGAVPAAPANLPSRTVQFSAVAATRTPAPGGSIPGTLLEATRTAERPVEAAEKRTEDARATGTVVIRNETGSPQTLVANTRLLSSSGVLFRLKDQAVVPARGEVPAQVYADVPGAGGNIGPSRFTIPGLSLSLQQEITGESSADMTGGVREVAVVTDAEIQRTLGLLREEIVADALEAWKTSLAGGSVLVPDAVSYGIVSSELPATGEAASPVAKVTALVRGVALDEGALSSAARGALGVPAGEAAAYSFSDWTFIITHYEEDAGLVTLTVGAQASPG